MCKHTELAGYVSPVVIRIGTALLGGTIDRGIARGVLHVLSVGGVRCQIQQYGRTRCTSSS
jgi:hypothetical protein